jgi:hypothetical protein
MVQPVRKPDGVEGIFRQSLGPGGKIGGGPGLGLQTGRAACPGLGGLEGDRLGFIGQPDQRHGAPLGPRLFDQRGDLRHPLLPVARIGP